METREHFDEMRAFLLEALEGFERRIGGRLTGVEGGLTRVELAMDRVESRLDSVERTLDTGFKNAHRQLDEITKMVRTLVRRSAPPKRRRRRTRR